MLKQAVFLVGGRGTRLGALTDTTPKPFITVAGRPFLAYLIDNAVRHGFTDVILLAGYLAEQLQAAWGPGSQAHAALAAEGVTISVIAEPEAAGTAGALLHARGQLDEQFLLANGDSTFSVTAASGAAKPATTATLHQGYLEGSNVDMAQAMAGMMNAQEGYDMDSQAVQYQSQMLQIANQITST